MDLQLTENAARSSTGQGHQLYDLQNGGPNDIFNLRPLKGDIKVCCQQEALWLPNHYEV
jgi:hypothetical protein